MISVKQAIANVLNESSTLGTEEVSLYEAAGRILAEDIFSDIDMPPFEKSMMDGYALRAEDCSDGSTILDVVATIPAGVYPDFKIEPGQAAKIMTGAPLPKGANSVQMIEKTEPMGSDKVKILEAVLPEKHVSNTGEVMEKGSKVISPGIGISPAVVGVLASVGQEKVQVFRKPEVGILITGDELVEVHQKPAAGQIRNSNGYNLYHQVLETGAAPVVLGVASDNLDDLREKISAGLEKDVLLISGGVSMGEFDLVEDVLTEKGVRIHFEKVNIKPGKPTVFGTKGSKLIFGLPGNPVSASTIFEVIVKPALRKMMGFTRFNNSILKARLQKDFQSKTKREVYHPAITSLKDGQIFSSPVASKGSADILAFSRSNSYLIIKPEMVKLNKGDTIDVMLRDEFWKFN